MNRVDLRRIAVIFLVASGAGWLSGQIVLCWLLGCLFYVGWLHLQLSRLLNWVRDRKHHEPPDVSGLFEELNLEIDYLRERHKKRKKKLTNYLKQFQQATRALPDATVVLDNEGTVQWANQAASRYLGIRWPDDVHQRLTNIIRNPELRTFMESLQDGGTIDIPCPTNDEMYLNVCLAPYARNQWLFVARDISDLHRANEMRRDFVGNVSHELRTPITVLRGYLENLTQQNEICPPQWAPALDQMASHVDRMQSLVEELLLLSRLEQDRTVQEPEPTSVPEMLAEIHKQARKLSGDAEHIFVLEITSDLMISGSYSELYSCFSNLIFNAVTYTPARGVIEIKWYKDAFGAHLEVKDNGVGIAPDHLPRLTERFYRVDSSRSRERGGTGLGLAIAKHVLARHAASLYIESELETGSLFRCSFPLDCIVDDAELLGDPAREHALSADEAG